MRLQREVAFLLADEFFKFVCGIKNLIEALHEYSFS